MHKSTRRGQLHRHLPYVYTPAAECVLTCGGGVELSIHAPFEEIGMGKSQMKNRKWKVFTFMLNSFQHLTSLAHSLLACKLLKQVQDDQKCVIACNDGNNFSLSTKNSHPIPAFPIQGRSKSWTYCIKFERQVEKCLA